MLLSGYFFFFRKHLTLKDKIGQGKNMVLLTNVLYHQTSKGVESKCVRHILSAEAERSVVHVRSGGRAYGESAWRIPVKMNDVTVGPVVDRAAEITIVAQSVYRQKNISSKNLNLAGP